MMNSSKKIPLPRIFTVAAGVFLIGIFIASFIKSNFYFIWPVCLLAISSLLLVAFLNFILKNKALTFLTWALIFLSLGSAFFSYRETAAEVVWPYGDDVIITGKVLSKPEIKISKQRAVIKVTEIETSKSHKRSSTDSEQLLVSFPRSIDLRYGDNIKFNGRIEEPQVFEDFDYAKYLKKYPIYGLVNQSSEVEKANAHLNLKERIYRSLYRFSDLLIEVLNKNLPEPHASLAAGIILGHRANIPDDLNDALSRTGLTHIIALSGFNVTIIVASLADLMLVYWGRRRVFFFGSILVLIFIIATGMAPSVVRAAVFSLLILFGKTVGRQGDKLNLMLLAALLLVLWNPFMLRYDLGFQLSFLAFAGIAYLSPIFLAKMEQKSFPLADYIRAPLADTLGAQLMTLPLLLANFGRLSFIAPVANILIVWILPYLMTAGFITVFAGLVWDMSGRFASYFLWPSLEYIIKTTTFLSTIPLASIEVGKNWLVGLIGYVLITAFLLYRKRPAGYI